MSLVGILYGRRRVVLNDQSSGSQKGIKGLLSRVKSSILQGVGAYKGIVLDVCTIEEHNLSANITTHPIESGSMIGDHVTLAPLRVSLSGIISESPIGFAVINNVQNVLNTFRTAFGSDSRIISQFEEINILWENRIPFDLLTNLKLYKNMIITNASIKYGTTSGEALDLNITCEQLTITETQLIEGNPQQASKGKASKKLNAGAVETKKIEESSISSTSESANASASEAGVRKSFASQDLKKLYNNSIELYNNLFE